MFVIPLTVKAFVTICAALTVLRVEFPVTAREEARDTAPVKDDVLVTESVPVIATFPVIVSLIEAVTLPVMIMFPELSTLNNVVPAEFRTR